MNQPNEPSASRAPDAVRIGIVSISDRVSSGVYQDQGLPALRDWLSRVLKNPVQFDERLIPDEQPVISAALIELVDAGCALVLTTGGTGPAPRDVTPEATLAVADREASLIITGNGDVLEPEHGVIAIGSGGAYAQSAARALLDHTSLSATDIVKKSLEIAGELCIYTNMHHTVESLD